MRKTAILAPLAAAALSATAFATGASAEPAPEPGVLSAYDGVCEPGEFCLYYNSDYKGSFADFVLGVRDFSTSRFVADGNGEGQQVKNNAASACNRDDNLTARVYYNSDWQGPYDTVPPESCRNLVNTYNENASFQWIAG